MKRSPASSQQSKSSLKAAESSPVHQEDAAMMEQLEGVCMSRGRLPPGESRDVNIDGVCMTTPGAVDLLDAATLKLSYGNKYGLVGRNGVGKTTLLTHISSHNIKGFPKHMRTLHVQQEVPGSSLSVIECVLAADVERTKLLKEAAMLEEKEPTEQIVTRLAEIYERLDEIHSETAEFRAKEVLKGLGFSEKMQEQTTQELSGGWRMRVALACALFLTPDILLLDEPTNHLDLETVIWLQDYLFSYEGTIIVVSHDREFLNHVVTDIIHFHKKQLLYYPNCNFDDFEQVMNEKKLKKLRLQENLDKHRQHIKESIQKMESAASKNVKDEKRQTQIASRKKKLCRMGMEKTEDGKKFNAQKHSRRLGSVNDNAGGWKNGKMTAGSMVERDDPSYKFKFPCSEPIGVYGPVLQLKEIAFAYQQPKRTGTVPLASRTASRTVGNSQAMLLQDVSMSLDMKSRIALVGANGAGKSTLLNLILGNLSPLKGEVYRHHNLKIGYFAQHHFEQLDLSKSALQYMLSTFPSTKEQDMRAHLGMFGIHGNMALQQMKTLSGGQKSRIVFASITFQQPHMLILDEPTNHLDFDAINALTDAIKNFQGGVILVSHNQALVASISEEIYVAVRGRVRKFEGTFDDYRRRVLAKTKPKPPKAK